MLDRPLSLDPRKGLADEQQKWLSWLANHFKTCSLSRGPSRRARDALEAPQATSFQKLWPLGSFQSKNHPRVARPSDIPPAESKSKI